MPASRVAKWCLVGGALAAAVQGLALALQPAGSPLPAHTSFLVVHLLSELFALVIAVMVVTVSWHHFDVEHDHARSLLLCGFTVVAMSDLVHTLSYEGMPPFLGDGSTERSIFFWLASRTAEVVTLGLLALGWMPRLSRLASLALGLAIGALLWSAGLYRLDLFPVTFVAGQGVTAFKASFETLLVVLNLAVAALLWRRARLSGHAPTYLLATSAWVVGIGGLSFVAYVAPSDFSNLFGHAYKIVAYALLYRATYLASLRAPFEALRASQAQALEGERRMRTLGDNLPSSVIYQVVREHDGTMRFLHVSDAIEALVGVPVAEALADASSLYARLDPRDVERVVAAERASAERMSVFDVLVRMRHRDGGQRWMQLRSAPRRLDDARVCWDGVLTDVTDARIVEQALAAREQQLAGIVETAMDAIITVDPTQRIRVFNQAAVRMFGVPAVEAIGQPLERFIPPAVRREHARHVDDFARTGATSRRMGALHVLHGRRADGEEFPIEAAISRHGGDGEMLMTAVVRDMTDVRRAEGAREAQIAAEAASRTKSEFISRMSHELRTPLNAMLGFVQLLETDTQQPLSERQRERLRQSRQAGWHLIALIDDLLDIARIESGHLDLRLGAVRLLDVFDAAAMLSEPAALERGVRLAANDASLARLHVRADAVRLRQVLVNLLSNAIKYNRPGGSVHVSAVHDGASVHLDVIDDGIGMDPAQQARLFEPFNRLGRERSGVQGTGIGLMLSRQLVEAMGGRVDVRSEPGRGTQVRVTLDRADAALPAPAAPTQPAALDADRSAPLAGLVLYVEDNPVNLLLVQEFFGRWPEVRLVSAELGADGLAQANALQPGLVLLDMQLPDMSGLDVLRALRRNPATSELPVVALSASAMPADVARATEAGASDYWTKPLDFDQFERGLRAYLLRRDPAPAADNT